MNRVQSPLLWNLYDAALRLLLTRLYGGCLLHSILLRWRLLLSLWLQLLLLSTLTLLLLLLLLDLVRPRSFLILLTQRFRIRPALAGPGCC